MMQQQKLSAARASTSAAAAASPRPAFARPSAVVRARAPKPAPAPEEKKKTSFFAQTISALDFQETRSKKDADLLYDAKYGKRSDDGKMTPEQYAALKRKVGGTAKGFFKEWVEEDVTPVAGFAAGSARVPFLPLLVGVVVALLGVTVIVVQRTA